MKARMSAGWENNWNLWDAPHKPTPTRLAALRLDGLSNGAQILYCHDCDYQISGAAHKPKCPECGSSVMFLARVDDELRGLCDALWRRLGFR